MLQGVDTESHEKVLDVTVTEGAVDVYAMDANDEQVWVRRDDGKLVVVDRASQTVLQTLDLSKYASDGVDLSTSHVVLGGGYAYSAATEASAILRIDTSTFGVLEGELLPTSGFLNGLAHDGENLWVVSWNAFALVKADPVTLDLLGSVAGAGSG